MTKPTDQPRILLVDDDPAAVMLIQIGLQDAGIAAELAVETSYHSALRRLSAYAGGPGAIPDLALLDLNLGDGSGHDLLNFIRRQPVLAHLPTVILSTSSYPKDIQRATAAGADRYMVKPSSYDELLRVLGELRQLLRPTRARNGAA